jgi:hypothetical protein
MIGETMKAKSLERLSAHLRDLCIRDAELRAHGETSEKLDNRYRNLVTVMMTEHDRFEAEIEIAWAQRAGEVIRKGHRNGPVPNCTLCRPAAVDLVDDALLVSA